MKNYRTPVESAAAVADKIKAARLEAVQQVAALQAKFGKEGAAEEMRIARMHPALLKRIHKVRAVRMLLLLLAGHSDAIVASACNSTLYECRTLGAAVALQQCKALGICWRVPGRCTLATTCCLYHAASLRHMMGIPDHAKHCQLAVHMHVLLCAGKQI